jgi:Domain of unknown function (DUF1707)
MSENERPGPEMRIGDAEREDAVKRLGEHYEAGRLTAEEHSERVDQALQARTASDLNALFADLPGSHAGARGSGPAGSGAFAGPPWARPGWQPPWAGSGGQPPRSGWWPRVGGVPVPLLALAAIAVLAGIACAIAGGHPPVFLIVLAGIAAVYAVRRRARDTTA